MRKSSEPMTPVRLRKKVDRRPLLLRVQITGDVSKPIGKVLKGEVAAGRFEIRDVSILG